MTNTNQGNKHQSYKYIGGGDTSYNGDAIKAMIAEGATGGNINEILVSWLQIRTGTSIQNISGIKAAFAAARGVTTWDMLASFASLVADNGYLLTDDGDYILLDDGSGRIALD